MAWLGRSKCLLLSSMKACVSMTTVQYWGVSKVLEEQQAPPFEHCVMVDVFGQKGCSCNTVRTQRHETGLVCFRVGSYTVIEVTSISRGIITAPG